MEVRTGLTLHSSNTQNGSVWRPFDIAVSDNDENVVWLACTQSGNYSYANGFKEIKRWWY